MHPLFKRGPGRRHGSVHRLGLYLLGWTPLAILLTYLLAVPGKLGWSDGAVLAIPLCLIYALIGLSVWYTCKATPIQKTNRQRLFLTHTVANVVVGALWVGIAKLLAYGLSQLPAFQGLYQRFAPQIPVLFGVAFLLYSVTVASNYVVLTLEESQAAQARAMETSILARDAELRALRAQINPHFLFNSLNSISALTSLDPAKAREMCILLADFLRMTLGLGEKALVPLREELDLLQRFLAIEKVRFGDRLQVDAYVEVQAQSCLVPPLILQPLVENAVIHGIAHLPQGGTVRLSAECSGGRLHLSLENSVDPDAPSSRKGGMGLANVRQRLEARYGKEATIRSTAEEERFRVTLSLPAETPEKENTEASVAVPEANQVSQ
jgi:two-component system, LytTR family, sensor histidine kinase AlgZ